VFCRIFLSVHLLLGGFLSQKKAGRANSIPTSLAGSVGGGVKEEGKGMEEGKLETNKI
jgi:hypothetical protein